MRCFPCNYTVAASYWPRLPKMELICFSGRARTEVAEANRKSARETCDDDEDLERRHGRLVYPGGDWSPTGNPGSGDAVVINGGEVQLESGDAGISVASISITGGLLAIQDPGVTQAVSGSVSVSGSGSVSLDGGNLGGAGGSKMTIGGALTNSSTNGSGVDVGNTNMTSADTLTVNGAGGLTNGNTSEINIEGSGTVQATLNVADDAAGFGTAGVETGTVFLENDALLEFKSGQITTVDGQLQLNGANARVADAATPASNSALTGLATVAGNFFLQNGATVAPTGALSVTGNASV